MKINKILKKILVFIIILYASIIFINQQKNLNAYTNEKKVLSDKIKQQTERKQTLVATKENITSPEYIEEVAREKLDMYLPNERVYIEMGE